MLVDETQRLTCPTILGLRCPVAPCPGTADPGVCSHFEGLGAWRIMSTEEQVGRLNSPRTSVDPAVRDAVNRCSSRGSVLPISMQDDCGCLGKERTECRAGRGAVPGRVTLRECLDCQGNASRP
jgi:hypothetical protein